MNLLLLHAPSIFFLLLVVSFLSIDILTSVCADDSSLYTNCSSHFSCGIVNNVGYPSWGGNRADYCGQPGFQLDCQDSTPKFIVNSITYRILNFCLAEQSLIVARDDYWKTICPSQYKNSSFDSTTFQYVVGFRNITLLHDCISSFNPMGRFLSSQCSSGSTNLYTNVSLGTNLEGVCKAVIIPVLDVYAEEVFKHRRDIKDAIDYGFGLKWVVDNGECKNCVKSSTLVVSAGIIRIKTNSPF